MFLARGLVDRESLLVDFEVPLLSTTDVVGIVYKSVLELAWHVFLLLWFRNFVHTLTVLLAASGELERSSLWFGTGGVLVLDSRQVDFFHSLELNLLVLTVSRLLGLMTHLIEGINIPLRVFQELVDVLTEHLFKITVSHSDLALLLALLASHFINLVVGVLRAWGSKSCFRGVL